MKEKKVQQRGSTKRIEKNFFDRNPEKCSLEKIPLFLGLRFV